MSVAVLGTTVPGSQGEAYRSDNEALQCMLRVYSLAGKSYSLLMDSSGRIKTQLFAAETLAVVRHCFRTCFNKC